MIRDSSLAKFMNALARNDSARCAFERVMSCTGLTPEKMGRIPVRRQLETMREAVGFLTQNTLAKIAEAEARYEKTKNPATLEPVRAELQDLTGALFIMPETQRRAVSEKLASIQGLLTRAEEKRREAARFIGSGAKSLAGSGGPAAAGVPIFAGGSLAPAGKIADSAGNLIRFLKAGIKSGDAQSRKNAALALRDNANILTGIQAKDIEDIMKIHKVLATDSDIYVRRIAAEALGPVAQVLGESQSQWIKTAYRTGLKDEDIYIRVYTAHNFPGISRIFGSGKSQDILEMFQSTLGSDYFELRIFAAQHFGDFARALGASRVKTIMKTYLAAVRSGDREVRVHAALAFGDLVQVLGPSCAGELLAMHSMMMISPNLNLDVPKNAALAIGRIAKTLGISHAQKIKILEIYQAAQNPENSRAVRAHASMSLADIAEMLGSAHAGQISELYHAAIRDKNPDVRFSGALALKHIAEVLGPAHAEEIWKMRRAAAQSEDLRVRTYAASTQDQGRPLPRSGTTERIARPSMLKPISKTASKPPDLIRIAMAVSGDAAYDPERKPIVVTVEIDKKNQAVEGVTAFSLLSPKALLESPFHPNPKQSTFLRSVITDSALLQSSEARDEYAKTAKTLFEQFFHPIVTMQVNILGNVAPILRFTPQLTVTELPNYSKWFLDDVVPAIQGKPGLSIPLSYSGKPFISLLLYGTVIRQGNGPPYQISFDSRDTVITGNPQNEVHDTTWSQLQSGAFDVERVPKADVGIEFVSEVGGVQRQ